MTVINEVRTAVSGLKGIQASFEQFSLRTDNKQAKIMYANAAEQTQQILDTVEPRITEIEQEEPQYKQL